MNTALSPSVSSDEIARFSALAHQWWDTQGPYRALHDLAPIRVGYILDQLAAQNKKVNGLSVLDIGCGGGLIAEALAAQGAKVTGIDASQEAIGVAKAHAAQTSLTIDYRHQTAEELAKTGIRYDAIVAFEIVEHVASLKSFLTAIGSLLNPGGLLLIATMNRTKRSYLLGIVAAEYVLRWVPTGTHDWDKFVRPSELVTLLEPLQIDPVDVTGLVYHPFERNFLLSKGNTAVNYFVAAKKVNEDEKGPCKP